ncbi:MAG: flavin monoamine oxidase family protein [Oscillochloridaceae bacterium umkhey_bin13]
METVIIVGAGAAGLAAARRLQHAGLSPLILEARPRIGGRIKTDRTYGPVELGAEFIHGPQARTWEFVRSAGLQTAPWGSDRRFAWGGQLVTLDDPRAAGVLTLYQAVAGYNGPELSVADLLDRLAAKDDPAATLARRWFGNLEGADLNVLSAAAFAAEHAASTNGEGNFHILDGYDRLIAHLAEGLRIRLEAPVTQIVWNEISATLTLADGEQLSARHVIITAPLGVLQAGLIAFAPALPVAKQNALHAIPMGSVTKLALWFDRQLWPDFTVLSTDGQIATWWPVESATTPTLMGYQGGKIAQAIAQLGEAAAIEAGLHDLEQLFGPEVRAACLGGRLADWAADPWSRGAYSYSAVGMGTARAVLAEPLATTLFFAGEAVATGGHLATVHGALESGEQAANKILAL